MILAISAAGHIHRLTGSPVVGPSGAIGHSAYWLSAYSAYWLQQNISHYASSQLSISELFSFTPRNICAGFFSFGVLKNLISTRICKIYKFKLLYWIQTVILLFLAGRRQLHLFLTSHCVVWHIRHNEHNQTCNGSKRCVWLPKRCLFIILILWTNMKHDASKCCMLESVCGVSFAQYCNVSSGMRPSKHFKNRQKEVLIMVDKISQITANVSLNILEIWLWP